MKSMYVFNHEHYHNALKPRHHSVVLPRYYRQRGGGIGGIIGSLTHYAIPVVQQYVIPEAKKAAIRTIGDVVSGTPITTALVNNGKTFLSNVGKDLIQPIIQSGASINRKRRRKAHPTVTIHSRKKPKSEKTKPVKKKVVCKKLCKTKRDIFS